MAEQAGETFQWHGTPSLPAVVVCHQAGFCKCDLPQSGARDASHSTYTCTYERGAAAAPTAISGWGPRTREATMSGVARRLDGSASLFLCIVQP